MSKIEYHFVQGNIQPITSPFIKEQGTADKMTMIYFGNDIVAGKEHV